MAYISFTLHSVRVTISQILPWHDRDNTLCKGMGRNGRKLQVTPLYNLSCILISFTLKFGFGLNSGRMEVDLAPSMRWWEPAWYCDGMRWWFVAMWMLNVVFVAVRVDGCYVFIRVGIGPSRGLQSRWLDIFSWLDRPSRFGRMCHLVANREDKP